MHRPGIVLPSSLISLPQPPVTRQQGEEAAFVPVVCLNLRHLAWGLSPVVWLGFTVLNCNKAIEWNQTLVGDISSIPSVPLLARVKGSVQSGTHLAQLAHGIQMQTPYHLPPDFHLPLNVTVDWKCPWKEEVQYKATWC